MALKEPISKIHFPSWHSGKQQVHLLLVQLKQLVAEVSCSRNYYNCCYHTAGCRSNHHCCYYNRCIDYYYNYHNFGCHNFDNFGRNYRSFDSNHRSEKKEFMLPVQQYRRHL